MDSSRGYVCDMVSAADGMCASAFLDFKVILSFTL